MRALLCSVLLSMLLWPVGDVVAAEPIVLVCDVVTGVSDGTAKVIRARVDDVVTAAGRALVSPEALDAATELTGVSRDNAEDCRKSAQSLAASGWFFLRWTVPAPIVRSQFAGPAGRRSGYDHSGLNG